MSRLWSVVLLLICVVGGCYGQMTHIEYDWVTGERETLPQWIFEAQGKGRYIGVSDPCLDSVNGDKQALLRAWFLSMMDDGFNVQILQEQFEHVQRIASIDNKSDKFTQFVRFSPQQSQKVFRRGRYYTSMFGERFVELIEVESDVDDSELIFIDCIDDGVGINVEYVLNGYERSVIHYKMRTELIINALCNGTQHCEEYVRSGTKRDYEISNTIDGLPISHSESGRYWYADGGIHTPLPELLQNRVMLMNGIWSGLLESLTYNIANGLHYAYTVKSLTESGTDGRDYTLTRSVYDGYASIRLVGYRIHNNQIEAIWDLQPE